MKKKRYTEEQIIELEAIREAIRKGELRGRAINKYSEVTNNSTILNNLIGSIIGKLTAPVDVPTELRTMTNLTSKTAQAAKYTGKPFYIYSPSREQWFKYDPQSGNLNPTKIPVMEGKVAMINHQPGDALNLKGVDSIFKKTSAFKHKQLHSVGEIRTVTNFYFGETDPTEEINEVIDTDSERILTESVLSTKEFPESNTMNESGTAYRKSATLINGEVIFEDESINFEDAKVARHGDGTISIETESYHWVYFPDKELQAKYGDFKGDIVKENFQVEIDGVHYLFDELHRVDKDAFAVRDQLIEEKKALRVMFEEAQKYGDEVVGPIYSKIRYQNTSTVEKFKNYTSLSSFMLHLNNDAIEGIDPEDAKEIKAAYAVFAAKKKAAWDQYTELRKKHDPNKIDYVVEEGSFFQEGVKRSKDDLLVFLTDDSRKPHAAVSENIRKSNRVYTEKGKYGAQTIKDELRGFGIPIATQDKSVGGKTPTFKLGNQGRINKSVYNLVKLADKLKKTDPAKKLYVELPVDMSAPAYGEVTGKQAMKALATAFANINRSIPDNIIFTNGGLRSAGVTRVVPFTVSNDPTESGLHDLPISMWSAKVGEASLASLWKIMRGYEVTEDISPKAPARKNSYAHGMKLETAFKELWRRWAEANPKKFEELAVKIGNKTIYDHFYGKSQLSVGGALAALMNERYVDNSWISYPRTTLSTPLNPGQQILPLANFNQVKFTTKSIGGKALVTLGDTTYVATITKMRVAKEQRFDATFIEQLGLSEEENPVHAVEQQYPFMKEQKFAVVSLTEFKGEIQEMVRQDEGYFSDALEAAGVKLTEEEAKLAAEANGVLGIDTKAKISDSINSSMSGTDRVIELKRAMGNNLPTGMKGGFDKIWIYGSTLEDGNNTDQAKGAVDAAKLLIDRYAKEGVEILVGNNSGVDEQVRSYIMANYPRYQPREDGLGFKVDSSYVPEYNQKLGVNGVLFKEGANVSRFNSNNTAIREGANLTGAWGTILSTTDRVLDPLASVAEYTVNIQEEEIVNWNDKIDPEVFKSMLDSLGLKTGATRFESVRGTLLTSEQRFLRHLIGAALAEQHNISIENLNNTRELDQLIEEVLDPESGSYNGRFASEYEEAYNILFDEENRINVSDVGRLAMARNRDITLNYAKELMPFGFFDSKFWQSPIFEFISAERANVDKGRGYSEMIKSPNISESTLQLINDAKDVTYRDAYNLLKTLGEDKIFVKGGKISGALTNKLFTAAGIKAFKDGTNLIVLDNNLINSDRSVEHRMDYSKKSADETVSDIEKELSAKDRSVYRYLKAKGMVKFDPYAKTIRVLIGNEAKVYEGTEGDMAQLAKDVRVDIALSYLQPLKGVSFSEEYLSRILYKKEYTNLMRLVNIHIKSFKSVKSNNFGLMFLTDPKGDLPSNWLQLESGAVYNGPNNLKVMVARDENDVWFAQAIDGSLYTLVGREWQLLNKKINNKKAAYEAATIGGIATPRGIGKTFSTLVNTQGVNIEGSFTVTRNRFTEEATTVEEILATDEDSGQSYRWEPFRNAWSPVSQPTFFQLEADADANPQPGAPVMWLPLVTGSNVLLTNGRAIDDGNTESKLVRDDKGEYLKTEDGWKQIKAYGGFSHPDVKFQKAPVSYTNNEGRRVASRRVSPDVMKAVFGRLFDNSPIEAELLSAEDIHTKYGAKYKDASGFVFEGTVVINLDKATLDTPLHEFGGHIYLAHLKATNPEAYKTVVEKALEHSMTSQIQEKYPELDPEELGEEVFSTLFGLENQHKLSEKSLTRWQKIRKLANDASGILDFFRGLFKIAFGTDTDFHLDTSDSLIDIINKLGDNIIFGDQSVLSTLSPYEVKNLKEAMDPVKSETDIQSKLEELGYIKRICH